MLGPLVNWQYYLYLAFEIYLFLVMVLGTSVPRNLEYTTIEKGYRSSLIYLELVEPKTP